MNSQTRTILRICIVGVCFLTGYFFLAWNLWKEQVRAGENYRQRISKQSIRKIRHPAERGKIISSDGVVLAGNAPSNRIVFHPAEMRQPGRRQKTVEHIAACAKQIGEAIGRNSSLSEAEIENLLTKRPAMPITVFSDLDISEITRATEMLPKIEGMELTVEPQRQYIDGKAACHLLGYVTMEDPAEAEDKDEYFYYVPDIKGGQGLEKRFDKDFDLEEGDLRGLRGIPSKSMVRVDHLGYIFEEIEKSSLPVPGNDLYLTIEWKAQAVAAKALEGKTGALALVNARTGEILALASSPTFDINLFIPKISKKDYSRLLHDPSKPFLNRALLGAYMPGSIIKPLIALSLLDSKTITPEDRIDCEGSIKIGNKEVKCWNWKSGGHGHLNLVHAIENSCNIYFITLARKEGLDKILRTLSSAGIGEKTGVPLPENAGILPTREIKEKRFKEKWTDFDTAMLSIGQGIILVSPLQAALFTAAIANGGYLLEPVLIDKLVDGNSEERKILYKAQRPQIRRKITEDRNNLEQVRTGMYLSVNGEKGTSRKAANSKIVLSGKTGTAEVGSGDNKTHNTWFIGYGEAAGRLYAIAILIENGISGGATCAPIAKQFFENYLAD